MEELKSKEQENARLREELNVESGSLRGILQRGLSVREQYSPEDIDVLYQTIEEFSWWRSVSDDSLIDVKMRLDNASRDHQFETEHLKSQILDLEGQLVKISGLLSKSVPMKLRLSTTENLTNEQLKIAKLETSLFEYGFHSNGHVESNYNSKLVADLEDKVTLCRTIYVRQMNLTSAGISAETWDEQYQGGLYAQ